MSDKQKKKIICIIITIILFFLSILIPKLIDNNLYNRFNLNREILEIILSLVPYFYIGKDVLKKAFKKIKKRQAFDENFLMSLATIGAYAMGESHEAVMVMLLYQIGELFQDIAVSKSRNNIINLVELKPDKAFVYIDNELVEKKPSDVNVNDVIVVKPGGKIPLDGKVIEGESLLNTSILTGESVPRLVKAGDNVNSGMINEDAMLKIKVTKKFDDSTLNKIISLIESAGSKKSKSEKFISNFAKIYTPIVCSIAILIFVIPLLYALFTFNYGIIKLWSYRALTSLVISCPCSILISVPLAFFSLIGGASKNGILIKGSNYVETLSNVHRVLLDKTGTMTKGVFEVVGIHHSQMSEDEILKLAAHTEFYSNHPIAKSIVKKYGKTIDESIISNVKEISGHGMSAYVNGLYVLLGNDALMKDNNISYIECNDVGTIVHVVVDNAYKGHILVNDVIKYESVEAITRLKNMNIKVCMLTGDKKEVALSVSKLLSIDNIFYELLPEDKLKIVENEIKNGKKNSKLAFVGDGINDAPALTMADVGIAMGGIGSDEAIELSDVVIMDDNPIKISSCIKYAKKCMFVVYENIIFSIVVKILFLIFSAIGMSNMAFATFADVGVMIICVINSIRVLFSYEK